MASQDSAERKNDQPEVTVEEALRLAQGHHKAGNLIIADRTYRDILKSVPDHFPTILYLGVLCYQRGNEDEALELLEKAVEADPEDISCWTNYGIALAAKKRYEEAIKAYDKALEIEPDNADTLSNKSYTCWLNDDFESAEKYAREALDAVPGHAPSLMNLGIALGRLGKYEDALAVWERLAEQMPDSSKVYSNWANTLRTMRQINKAEELVRRAIELDGRNPEAWNNLGLILRERGVFDEAEKAYRKATDIKPSYANAHQNLAILLYDAEKYQESIVAGRYALSYDSKLPISYIAVAMSSNELGEEEQAREYAEKATIVAPDNAEAYLVLAEILISIDRLDEGEAAMHHALQLDTDSVRSYVTLSGIREMLGNYDGALEALDEAAALAPHMPIIWRKRSHVLHLSDRMDEAWESIDKAIELAPENAGFILTKVDMLLTTNRKDEARELFERARELGADLVGVYYAMGSFKKYEDADDPDLAKMHDIYNAQIDDLNPREASCLCFALSKAYEDLGEYDKSFEYLREGNAHKAGTLYYKNETQDKIFLSTRSAYNAEIIDEYKKLGCDSDVPVFIVGMPRSGTTLTEQIISSHPDVYGAGELNLLSRINRELGPMTPANIEELGAAYVEYLKKLDKTGKAKRITDKMPGNFTNIGFISCILPNAKIIHCRRNPVDTCLSNYKQNFASGQYWSYDLDDLAKQYKRYEILMDYWEQIVPGRVLHIDYEETVGNFEEQARKLIDYIELPWDDACLEPHKQKRTILTASKDQVIQPVYKTSVQKWKRYEEHLQPLVRELLPDEALS